VQGAGASDDASLVARSASGGHGDSNSQGSAQMLRSKRRGAALCAIECKRCHQLPLPAPEQACHECSEERFTKKDSLLQPAAYNAIDTERHGSDADDSLK
jgi:hypothetical protein